MKEGELDPRFAERIRPLVEKELPGEDQAELSRRRRAVLPHLRLLVRDGARRRQARRRGMLAATLVAVAAACVLWFAKAGTRAPDAPPSSARLDLTVIDGQALVTGDSGVVQVRPGQAHVLDHTQTVATGSNSHASIMVPPGLPRAGLHIGLKADTRLHLPPVGDRLTLEQVRLESGEIQVRVPRLPLGTGFAVLTATARVSVHGTAFSVRLLPTAGPLLQTCVRVTEGLVSVESGGTEVARLAAGMEWGCRVAPEQQAREPAPSLGRDAAPAAEPAPGAQRLPRRSGSSLPSEPARPSTLAEENALLAEAVRAGEQGRYERAAELARKLLTRYPNSPLTADATQLLRQVESTQKIRRDKE